MAIATQKKGWSNLPIKEMGIRKVSTTKTCRSGRQNHNPKGKEEHGCRKGRDLTQ